MNKIELLDKLKQYNQIGFEVNDYIVRYYGSEKNREKRLNILKSLADCHALAKDLCDVELVEKYKDVWPLKEEPQ